MVTSLKRTTIFLPGDQHEALRRIAFVRRTSMAQLIRDSVLEIIEDAEDVREGLKALADEEGTVSWDIYRRQRRQRKRALSG